MKNAVPPTAKIAKDAKECVQECVSEFISFITSEAAEKCQLEKRKTIGGEDILYAMVSLGFENYAETLKIHLAKLRQVRYPPTQVISIAWGLTDTVLFFHVAPDGSLVERQRGSARRAASRRRLKGYIVPISPYLASRPLFR